MVFSLKKQKSTAKNGGLIKIGQLAQKVGVLPSTINFYTNEGLLIEGGRSKGGYRLYEPGYAIARIKKIQKFQAEKRLTIEEIKKLL
ncbi:MAG: MerR family transcriptional regulator [Patescibacteria group bacterium]|jgi:DNA-binding transcriptional MerR regulator